MEDTGALNGVPTLLVWLMALAAAFVGLAGVGIAAILAETGVLVMAALPLMLLWILIIELRDRGRAAKARRAALRAP
jgi:hypothetical protein